jgi:transcriptional regulator with XRE-family HTH domain
MIQFNPDELDNFLAVVYKYMKLRGGLTQKDLALKLNASVSTMSRFINKKTKDLDPQLIAGILVVLDIPLSEVIEFIVEESEEKFKNLIAFQREQLEMPKGDSGKDKQSTRTQTTATIGKGRVPVTFGQREETDVSTITKKISGLSPRQKVFVTDFLDLDDEGKDVIVDLSNAMFRYFKQRAAAF